METEQLEEKNPSQERERDLEEDTQVREGKEKRKPAMTEKKIKHKSLILAQDERWRRA